MSLFEIRDTELSVAEVIAAVTRPEAGGIAVFVGTVRHENAGLPVTRLEYQAYASMAAKEMARIGEEIALEITDEAVQMHGAMGVTQDVPLARMWTGLRTLRLADGPDAVHRRQVARAELKRYTNQKM